MKELGVPTAVRYPVPLDEQPAYRHLSGNADPRNSRAAARRVLSLPMSADPDAVARRVVSALVSAVGR